MMAYRDPLPRAQQGNGLRGIGIGTAPIQGRARVTRDPIEAVHTIGPGEILVTAVTDSAFNVVLSMVDGLVTEHGGAMSHAALMARELGIPAILGVPDALAQIPDGALIELDPTQGLVRLLPTDTSD